MLVIDEAKAKKIKHDLKVAQTREKIDRWIAEQEEFAKFNDDEETSPLNHMKKLGKPMHWQEFERRCKKINPHVEFWCGPASFETNHKNMGRVLPNGTREVVTFYPMDVMPERSMHRRCEEDVPDGDRVADPADFGGTEWQPLPGKYQTPEGQVHSWSEHWEPNGQGIGRWAQKDPSLKPGWRKRVSAWGEWKRGWRSCLVKGVVAGLFSPEQVEIEFLADNTPEWKGNLGKGEKVMPW